MSIWTSYTDLIAAALFTLSSIYNGNLGFAILTLSLIARLAMLPLTLKLAQRSMTRQKVIMKLQPELDKLKKKYRKDPAALSRETMNLYRRHGAHPLDGRGILGVLVQVPVFLGLFSAIKRGVVSGGRFLWISDLAKPDFLLAPIVALLAFLAAILAPATSEQGRAVAVVLPAILTLVFLWQFASGLGLYWAANNAVGIVQAAILRYREQKQL